MSSRRELLEYNHSNTTTSKNSPPEKQIQMTFILASAVFILGAILLGILLIFCKKRYKRRRCHHYETVGGNHVTEHSVSTTTTRSLSTYDRVKDYRLNCCPICFFVRDMSCDRVHKSRIDLPESTSTVNANHEYITQRAPTHEEGSSGSRIDIATSSRWGSDTYGRYDNDEYIVPFPPSSSQCSLDSYVKNGRGGNCYHRNDCCNCRDGTCHVIQQPSHSLAHDLDNEHTSIIILSPADARWLSDRGVSPTSEYICPLENSVSTCDLHEGSEDDHPAGCSCNFFRGEEEEEDEKEYVSTDFYYSSQAPNDFKQPPPYWKDNGRGVQHKTIRLTRQALRPRTKLLRPKLSWNIQS